MNTIKTYTKETLKKRGSVLAGIMASLMMVSSGVMAADNLSFTGMLSIPNCTINNNNVVEVDFGEIEIQTLKGASTPYHGRDFDIAINCPYNTGTPKLTISAPGNVVGTPEGIIKTSKFDAEGLMIYLRHKGGTQAFPLGSAVDVSSSITSASATQKTLTLNAALGRHATRAMADLTPGDFTATASMVLKYE